MFAISHRDETSSCLPCPVYRIHHGMITRNKAEAGIPIERAEISQVPQNYISLGENDARKVLALLEDLEDHDDVQKVHSNFDVAPEVLEKLQAG